MKKLGKDPFTRIYTLEINGIRQLIKNYTNSDKLTKQALHICRGHFKDFSHGKGLFGKAKGLYWWGMQTRGSKDDGEIIKDYKIKV